MSATTLSISQPFTSHNLTVFLLHGPDTWPGGDLKTLEEAIDEKLLLVHETGSVNELAVENVSDFEVFLQAGDIVKGGLQDRVFGVDLIVPAHSGRLPINTFCVESGRWRPRRARHGESESTSHFHESKHRLASKRLKLAAFHRRSQTEVWQEVSTFQQDLASALSDKVRDDVSPTSLPLSLENEELQLTVADYLRELQPIVGPADGATIGYAFAINGELNSAELYTSGALFRKLWPRLIQSSAIEALGQRSTGPTESTGPNGPTAKATVTRDELRSCLHQLPDQDYQSFSREVSPRIRLLIRENEKIVLQDTCDLKHGRAWIHRHYLVK